MRMLLVLASLGAIALPSTAVAQNLVDQGFSASVGSGRVHNGDIGRVRGDMKLQGCDVRTGRGQRGDGDGRGRGRRGSCVSNGTWIDAGEWALYNNRSWESDSYNDWWHDQPWRSYPRWVSKNEDCQRQWWSGGGWRC
jgi:hypothetical protein